MMDFDAKSDPESMGNMHLTVTGTMQGVNHSFHQVASMDDQRPGEYCCLDCKVWFPKEEYASPYKHQEPPFMFWHERLE